MDNAGLSRWLYAFCGCAPQVFTTARYTRWEEKDKLLSQIKAQGVFPGPQHHIPMDWRYDCTL
jgi:hypothetical protein